ncbi:hypothetical protein OHA09_26555 [Streptomyces longwoodensis]|uniref:hypothetical protein n=1 Tax=Streptomyces longwoodensis TaxID=68231 RepID=UPI002E7FF758|nr:hypothetical protein [Streptomyces longwoodensis]WUC60387.1 hypothetical protein OHA09_26555 [Streptomyces longwoodensis]
MATRRLRPGTGRLGAALLAGALAGVLATGCGAPAATGADDTHTTPPPAASPAPTEDLCTRVVAHWSREVLDGTTYGDYQSMGLSNGQYEILRDVVDEARAEKGRAGAAAADALIDRRAREGCVAWYRSGGPGEGPWQ